MDLLEAGEKLGLSGEELRRFVGEQQARERDERAEERELEKLRLEAERLKIEAEEKDKERQIEIEKLKFEAERQKVENEEKERKRQTEMEKLKMEAAEREKAMEAAEREKAREATEREKEAERKHQLEMKKLEVEMAAVGPPTGGQAVAKVPRLPSFVDEKDDLDAYLLRFERFATSSQWAEDKWAAHLSALLTEEGFRAKFRQNKAEKGESPQQFIVRLTSYLERWVELAESSKSYEGLRDLFVKEQFLEACPRDLAVRLREQGPSSLDELAGMAQHYLEAHERELGKKEEEEGKKTTPVRSRAYLGTTSGVATCYTCGDPSHFARDCPMSKQDARSTGATSFFGGRKIRFPQTAFDLTGQVEGKTVPLLLDTGSTQTLIREDLVDPTKIAHDNQGGITCIHGDERKYPTALVEVQIGHRSYKINAKVTPNLPHPAILGRDVPHLAELVQQCASGRLARESLVATRAQARKAAQGFIGLQKAMQQSGVQPRQFLSTFGHYRNGYDRGGTKSYNFAGYRPKLRLAARTKPFGSPHLPAPGKAQWRIFGGAKPVDTAARERMIDEKLSQQKVGVWRHPTWG
ncbi:PREDICTED: uncharacterized protein LOC109476193 [Branchiostoma belcheri]|uniref:Uncharacterized protein LOC109476193 n=1 Tax=Branchiostoma belcheri TaxID=7741 RepID=A0A6P4Z7L2_BRABE|nr:PREDICTED: uncharacterized protein LOC109476193 [Branchiostoma belcheri]